MEIISQKSFLNKTNNNLEPSLCRIKFWWWKPRQERLLFPARLLFLMHPDRLRKKCIFHFSIGKNILIIFLIWILRILILYNQKNRKLLQYGLNSSLQWFRIHPCKKFVSPRNISQFSIRNHQRKSFRAFCVCLFRANRKIYNFSKWYFKRLTSLEISGEKTWENWENKIPLIKWSLCAKKLYWESLDIRRKLSFEKKLYYDFIMLCLLNNLS